MENDAINKCWRKIEETLYACAVWYPLDYPLLCTSGQLTTWNRSSNFQFYIYNSWEWMNGVLLNRSDNWLHCNCVWRLNRQFTELKMIFCIRLNGRESQSDSDVAKPVSIAISIHQNCFAQSSLEWTWWRRSEETIVSQQTLMFFKLVSHLKFSMT